MTLLDLVAREFISIVEALEQTEPVENDRIIIEREHFKKLLEKYLYITFREKTKVYKTLNLIIHDKNNYTMPCKDIELKKTVRRVIINYNAYKIMKSLFETGV